MKFSEFGKFVTITFTKSQASFSRFIYYFSGEGEYTWNKTRVESAPIKLSKYSERAHEHENNHEHRYTQNYTKTGNTPGIL